MLIYNNYLLLKQFFMVKFNALSSCKVSNELIAMQLIMPFFVAFFPYYQVCQFSARCKQNNKRPLNANTVLFDSNKIHHINLISSDLVLLKSPNHGLTLIASTHCQGANLFEYKLNTLLQLILLKCFLQMHNINRYGRGHASAQKSQGLYNQSVGCMSLNLPTRFLD